MFILETIEGLKIAFNAIRTNKMRSSLTTLGVVIGVVFVILMGWFLNGLDRSLEDTINLFGTDVLYVDKWDWAGGKRWEELRNRKDISLFQANEFASKIQSAKNAIATSRRWNGAIKYKGELYNGMPIIGTSSEDAYVSVGTVEEGRFFSAVEDIYATPVAVIGHNVALTLFPQGDAIGHEIDIKGRPFKIIGIVEKRGTMMMKFVDNYVYIPLKCFTNLYGLNRSFTIAVKAGGDDRLDDVRSEVMGVMRSVRNNQPGDPDDFSINESQTFREQTATLRIAVWSIGIGMTTLSFLVGIIGIMNIMFVSVTERTKEIGIRKALGAPRRSILFQFLVEAASLCFLGAVIAFVICSAVIFSITHFFPDASFLTPYIPPQLLFIASFVALFAGVLAGIIPAFRASRMEPVDALRYE